MLSGTLNYVGTEAPKTPKTGDVYVDKFDCKTRVYNGSSWEVVEVASSHVPFGIARTIKKDNQELQIFSDGTMYLSARRMFFKKENIGCISCKFFSGCMKLKGMGSDEWNKTEEYECK